MSSQRKILKTFQQQSKFSLMTSRFSNKTWQENICYREKQQNIGCIYCSPEPITNAVPIDTIMFILEMNNDQNKIIGIGMVKNKPIVGKYHVYDEGNYNRYVYIGKNRIAREDMTAEEEEIMKAFDILCFTGNRHMKRGQGIKKFPPEMLYRCSQKIDLVQFISQMFKTRIAQKTT
jgi:hypothetical protein